MINWKTSLFGFLALVPQLFAPFLTIVPTPWDKLVLAIFGILAFYSAKDKNVTGGTIVQPSNPTK
jgi:hypothetical protein